MNAESHISKEDARFALIALMMSRSYEKISELLAALESRAHDGIMCGPAGLVGGEQKIMCGPAGLADRNSQIVCGPAGLVGGEQKIICGPAGLAGGEQKIMCGPAGLAGGKQKTVCGPAGLADRNSQIICGPAGLTDKSAQASEHRETREVKEAAVFGQPDSTFQSESSGGQPPEADELQKQAVKTVEEYEMSVKLAELVDIVIRVRPATSVS